ncbi:MAG: trigger factor [Actinomycetota bacterium]|jgi:trigger factor|nr:trigger factor [Actinomycetota bacterium]
MRATAAPEEGNKVRLSVELDPAEIDGALDDVVRRLARQVRVPGFRPGKVPRRVIEARMGGAAALRDEALREALPAFYAQAVTDTEVDPIDQPEIDITSDDPSGAVRFDAVVAVRPSVSVAGYQGLVVTVPALEVSDEDVDAQVDRLRATTGELVEVDRPAADGDRVTLDIEGRRHRAAGATDEGAAGGSGEEAAEPDAPDADLVAEDFLYEVGSGGVVAELDDQLRGASAGDTRTFDAVLGGPAEGSEPGEEADGQPVTFTVSVKAVKELVLPEVTDEWASEASEFATVDELRADIAERLRRVRALQARAALRQGTEEALVELVAEDVPGVLVEAELRERVHDLEHRLEHQGMAIDQFVAMTGRTEQELVDDLRDSAVVGVKLDLALRAVADAEGIEVDDEELDAELDAMAERLGMKVEQVRAELERGGRLPTVRSEQRKAKAMRWLLDTVQLVDEDGNPVSREVLEAGEDEEDSE